MNSITRNFLSMFTTPSAEVLACRELEDAKRQLLSALSAQEFYASQVDYHSARVKRLSKTLAEKP